MAAADVQSSSSVFKLHFPSYMKVYDGDYLEHHDLYEALKPLLQAKASFSVLDLGCGDAYYICKAIAELGKGSAVTAFTGVDPSQPALDCAMANVEKLVDTSCALAWEATDMQSFLRQSTASQDFILASFSMHHLESQEAKLEVLQESRRLLAPCKGKLLMVDVIRWPAESIQAYRDRLCRYAADEWTLMPIDGRNAIIEHMQEYDFPDTLDNFRTMSQEAGFSDMKSFAGSKKGWCSLLVFET